MKHHIRKKLPKLTSTSTSKTLNIKTALSQSKTAHFTTLTLNIKTALSQTNAKE